MWERLRLHFGATIISFWQTTCQRTSIWKWHKLHILLPVLFKGPSVFELSSVVLIGVFLQISHQKKRVILFLNCKVSVATPCRGESKPVLKPSIHKWACGPQFSNVKGQNDLVNEKKKSLQRQEWALVGNSVPVLHDDRYFIHSLLLLFAFHLIL